MSLLHHFPIDYQMDSQDCGPSCLKMVSKYYGKYLQPIITQYFIDNKSEIWLLFLIAHSKR